MKNILILSTLFLLVSCGKDPIIIDEGGILACTEVQYGEEFSSEIDETVCFPDGNMITIKLIEDEYCPCDAVCVWQGELAVMLETEDANGEKDLINSGTESHRVHGEIFAGVSISSLGYEYENDIQLPDCNDDFDHEKTRILMTVTHE